jgi:hypothetical protein
MQGPKQKTHPPKVRLSAKAKARLKVHRRAAQVAYQVDLNKAWDLMDKTIAKIAEDHGKSFQHVQFALHMGRKKEKRTLNTWNAYMWKTVGEGKAGKCYGYQLCINSPVH